MQETVLGNMVYRIYDLRELSPDVRVAIEQAAIGSAARETGKPENQVGRYFSDRKRTFVVYDIGLARTTEGDQM
ncbi:hypothetical protein A2863_00545 [Candidatus Woesebacteria bacterium RIFCSPHIGHO2_01_FULL_38_9b]|uniref:Nitroreductase domain-containing protein n=1 Tax=Candidatus Woesebacteria bacterium RIFCSPHIGHO2_01_FULL_38_9b TaxID=1802493 RepID=A0A1F7Y1Y2_9BACT|nr:MAG: hypothetical protein A2863_00545 [Candidatus Woesebacteria bacterium RIFCSPHIGHO2_01_FULL_38_9b]